MSSTGTSLTSPALFQLGSGVSDVGVINLNAGGLIQTSVPISNGLGSGTFNFNGGTLQASAGTANFLTVTTANIQNGGTRILTTVGIRSPSISRCSKVPAAAPAAWSRTAAEH